MLQRRVTLHHPAHLTFTILRLFAVIEKDVIFRNSLRIVGLSYPWNLSCLMVPTWFGVNF